MSTADVDLEESDMPVSSTNERVIPAGDASILSLIARLARNPARQTSVFLDAQNSFEDPFSKEVAEVLVGRRSDSEASVEVTGTAKAMREWVDAKTARIIHDRGSRSTRSKALGMVRRRLRRS